MHTSKLEFRFVRIPRWHLFRCHAATWLGVLIAVSAWAQQAPRPATTTRAQHARVPTPAESSRAAANITDPAGTTTEPTIVLSPFEVVAEEDSGYKATSTLAGTRLRSELKDLAASISVVTK